MKFEMTVSHQGQPAANGWIEKEDRAGLTTEADVKAWAAATVANFNATLKVGEQPRTLHAVVVTGVGVDGARHDFRKTNLVTLTDHRGSFDNVACEHCACKARRYGLTTIVRQTPFRSKKWANCPGKA